MSGVTIGRFWLCFFAVSLSLAFVSAPTLAGGFVQDAEVDETDFPAEVNESEGEVPAGNIPNDEHPEGDHPEGDHATGDQPSLLSLNPGAAVWNLLIFLLVLTILGVFVWPKVLEGLQAREDKIHSDLDAAKQANETAQASLAEYQQKLSEAQATVQSMLAEARRDAEQVGAKIVAEAKADADRQRERAVSDIEAAKVVAIGELANQTSDLAMSLARQVVGRELNEGDHADLIRQSLDKLPSRN
ncbi:F0F1 ATP synthase subunit B [Planctomycetaceae bacterium SH139]